MIEQQEVQKKNIWNHENYLEYFVIHTGFALPWYSKAQIILIWYKKRVFKLRNEMYLFMRYWRIFFHSCQVVNVELPTVHLPRLLCDLGMTPYDGPSAQPYSQCYIVVLNGKILGWVADAIAYQFTARLRYMKATHEPNVSYSTFIFILFFHDNILLY